jgi:hypothetical protein
MMLHHVPQGEGLTGFNLTFPLVRNHAQTLKTMDTVKKLNTRDPPKTTEWKVQAFSGVIPTRVTAIAQGSIQSRLDPRAWKKYHRGVVASRVDAICALRA